MTSLMLICRQPHLTSVRNDRKLTVYLRGSSRAAFPSSKLLRVLHFSHVRFVWSLLALICSIHPPWALQKQNLSSWAPQALDLLRANPARRLWPHVLAGRGGAQFACSATPRQWPSLQYKRTNASASNCLPDTWILFNSTNELLHKVSISPIVAPLY